MNPKKPENNSAEKPTYQSAEKPTYQQVSSFPELDKKNDEYENYAAGNFDSALTPLPDLSSYSLKRFNQDTPQHIEILNELITLFGQSRSADSEEKENDNTSSIKNSI